jgi:DNA repair exonuclease SbcCD ATPase subunit
MIHFRYVKWRNFLSTGNISNTIQFDKNQTTLVIGDNGAGKSTVLDALCFVLFGKAYRSIKKAQLVNSINQRDCEVEIEFQIGTNLFKVIRGIKPNNFQIFRNGKFLDQDAHSKDFQNILETQILKLNYRSFTQVVILGSSCFIPFMQLPTSHRREVVEDILDIKIFSIMNLLLKQHYKMVGTEVTELSVQNRLNESNKQLQEKHLGNIEEISNDRIKALHEEKEGYQNDLANKQAKIDKLEEKITTLIQSEADHDKLASLKIMLESRKTNTEKKIKFFDEKDSCDVCEQPIDKSFGQTRVQDLNHKVVEYEAGLEEMKTELNSLYTSIQEMSGHSRTINAVNTEIKSITGLLERCQNDLDKLNDEKGKTDKIKEEIAELDAKITNVDDQIKELKQENFYLDICKNLLHDTGIKSKIIKQYLPVMNQTIQRYLGILDFYVNFTLNETFEETIKSRYRDDFSYASFSEGEKMRIDLALMFTWREIARIKNSTNTNLLILDEVFDSSLDASGTDDFLKILNSFEIKQNIFVISHKGDILYDKFLSIIKFAKVKNFSKMVES